MFSGASGFYNAPIIKIVSLTTGLSTFLLPHFGVRKQLELVSLEVLTQNHQVWRLVTNNLFFSSSFEAFFGIFLLYHFRLFERQMGSSKFAAFAVTTWGTSLLFTLAFFVLFSPKGYPPASGPFSLIYALLVQFYFEVPATYRFRFLGISASNKLIIYLMALQLLGSKLPGSLFLAISGLLAGIAYRSDILPLKRFTIPQSLVSFATNFILPIVQQPRPTQTQRNLNIAPRARPPAAPAAPVAPVAPPAESDVAHLMDMGFSREAALGALRNANNDMQLAAALLLDPS